MKITLPYPPSLNRLYRTFNGRVIISKDGRLYKKAITKEFLQRKTTKFTGEVAVSVNVYRPQKRGDLDNTLKPLSCVKSIIYGIIKAVQGMVEHTLNLTTKFMELA